MTGEFIFENIPDLPPYFDLLSDHLKNSLVGHEFKPLASLNSNRKHQLRIVGGSLPSQRINHANILLNEQVTENQKKEQIGIIDRWVDQTAKSNPLPKETTPKLIETALKKTSDRIWNEKDKDQIETYLTLKTIELLVLKPEILRSKANYRKLTKISFGVVGTGIVSALLGLTIISTPEPLPVIITAGGTYATVLGAILGILSSSGEGRTKSFEETYQRSLEELRGTIIENKNIRLPLL